jgi:hypothetical protein
MNLMLNGIEATKDTGGELAIRSGKNGDGQVVLSVSDFGVGLPVENLSVFSTRSSGPKSKALAWDYPSAGGSLSLMAAGCGLVAIQVEARHFISLCPPR